MYEPLITRERTSLPLVIYSLLACHELTYSDNANLLRNIDAATIQHSVLRVRFYNDETQKYFQRLLFGRMGRSMVTDSF